MVALSGFCCLLCVYCKVKGWTKSWLNIIITCTFEHYILHFLHCRKMTKVNVLVMVDITSRTFYHLIFRVH